MTDWLLRAQREIAQSVDKDTANTAERNLTAVMAVREPSESESSQVSIGSNGSALATGFHKAEAVSNDDRRTCDQCGNLTEGGLCLAARRGEIVANRIYAPIRDLPRRCEGYAPGAADADRRLGRERWPGLIQKGGDHATD